ncbi:MAG: aminomethyltransferase family protein, partial [Candidatus Competibacteraceae bacterium]|nr:aminomethyltransferase family protein [Candidatus Competibacteraceae bacterium]
MMAAIAVNRNTGLEAAQALRIFDSSTRPGETFLFRLKRQATLFVIAPVNPDFIVAGGGSRLRVQLQFDAPPDPDLFLPEPLGKVCDEWRIRRGTAKAYTVKKGQFIQVIDVEGQQCSDFMAMRSDALDKGLERYIDGTVSRTMARSAYPLPGLFDKFYDQDMRPLLSVRQDTVGRHDTFALACTGRGYEERGFPGHLNCSDNISAAFSPYGISRRRAWPAINFFFNSWIDWHDNHISADEAWSRPGDYLIMQALTDLVCVSTACPDDVDSINGWNPTDIHVRIYEENTAISQSMSWRAKPDDAEQLTKHSAFHPRTSKLTGSFRVSRDLWMPTHFDATGAVEEYWACRNNATLQDMSSLLKFDVVGPDAAELLQHCLTRNVAKLAQHRGLYALICDQRGSVIDDGTLFRLESTAFRWCCGSTNSALHLREQAEKLRLNVRVLTLGHKMPNLALQGPKSRDILQQVVFTQPHRPTLGNLKWFGFTIARLHDRDGPMFMLSRSGFTGELGYEIFCDQNDAEAIWDGLIEAGEAFGLVPMGSEALAMLRIEAGLMVAGAEFGPDSDAMESGLAFAVDLNKDDFIGHAALQRNSASPRRKLVGLRFAGNDPPGHGDGVFSGREQVGVVTSACYSPQLGHAIAMARIAIENSAIGTEL